MKKTVFLALAILTLPALAQNPPPATIDISRLPKETRVIDDVIVPVPSEIFAVLDKLGRPNWVAVQRPIKGVAQPFGGQPQVALYLGTVIAEGFIAVEATDAEEVKNIGRSVLNLSKSLNVEKEVAKRANAIIQAADREDWAGVKRELDGALSEVKQALSKMKSPELAHLVALGGWLRGTEALCEVVMREYKPDSADLLHQPALLNHFDAKLAGLKDRYKREPLVPRMQKGLADIRPLIGDKEGVEIPKETVEKIGKITADMVKAIQTK